MIEAMAPAEALPRCRAITVAGAPCPVVSTVNASGYCLFHDVERAVEAAATRRRGTDNSVEAQKLRAARAPVTTDDPVPPLEMTLEGLSKWQGWVVVALAAGKLDANTARALTSGLTNLRALLEKRDLGDEFKKARAALAEHKQVQKRRTT